MRAAICTRYGPPEALRIEDVEKPVPRDHEVLIKIHVSTVNSSDCFVRSGIRSAPLAMQMMMRLVVGFTRPRKRVLGRVLAGEIEETGKAVTRFRLGDRVYAFTKLHFGAYAEYTCLPETSTMAYAPSNVTLEEAAAVPYGGLLALHYLRRGNIRSGQQVLIYGASSAVGTSAVQLAKHFGAAVTAVCGPTNLELARSLGASLLRSLESRVRNGDSRPDNLTLDRTMEIFTADLRHRRIDFHVPCDPLSDTAWILMLQRIYIPPNAGS